MQKHWTERSTNDFLYKIKADFIIKLQERMESLPISQEKMAKLLNVSKGRVSQILNNPGNITLKKIVEYARVLGLKVSIIAYDDNDPNNEKGPIDADIFYQCWERSGMPRDYWALQERVTGKPFSITPKVVVTKAPDIDANISATYAIKGIISSASNLTASVDQFK